MPLRMGSKRKRVEKQSGRRPAHSSSGSSPQSQPITRQSPQPISRLSPQAITRQSPQPITRQSPKPQPAPRPSQRGLSPQPRSEATPYASTAVGSDTVARPVLKGWATERDLTGQRQPIIMSSTGSHVTSPAGRHAPLTAAKSSPVLNQDDIVNTVATPRDFTPRLDMTKSTPDIPDTANYENVQSPTSPKSPTWYQQRFPNRAVPAFDFSVPLSRRSAGSPRNSYVGGSPRNSYAGYSPAYSQSPNYPQSSNSSVYSPSSSNVDPSYQRSSGSYSQSYTSGNTTAYDDTPQRQQKSYDRRSLPPQFLQQQRQDFLKDNTKPDPANSLSSMPTTREEEEIDPEIAGLKPQPPNDLDLRPMYSPPAPPVRDISSLKYVGFNKNHEKYPSWPVTTGQPPPNLGGPPVDAHPVDAHLGDKVHTAGQSDSADSGKSQLAELNDKNSPGLERKGSDENKQPRNQSDPGFKQKPKKSFYTTRKPKFEPPKENNYENLKMEEERFNEFCEHSKSGYPPPKLDPDGHNYGDEKYNIPSPPERDVPNLDEKSLVQKIAAVISPSSQQSPFQFHQYNVNNYDNGASRFHKTDMATSPLQTVQSKVPGMYFQQAMNAQNLLHTPNGTSNSKNMVDSGTSPLSSPNDDRGREMLRTISANVRNDSTQSPLEKNRGLIIRQMPYYNTSTQTDHGLHSTEKLSGESQSRTSEGSGVGPMSRSSIGADGDSDQHKQLRHETNSDSQLSQQLSISTTQSISSLSHSSGIGSMSFSDHSSAPMLRKLSEEFYRGRLSGSMQNEKRFSSASSYEDPKSPRAESIYSGNLTQAESYSSVIIHPHETSGPFGSSPSLTSSKQDLSDMELETAADQRHSQFKPRYSMDSNIFNKSTTSMTSLPPRSLQESRFTSESNLSPANCTPRNHSQSMLQLSRPPSSLMENAQGRSNTYSSESSTSSRPHGSMEARSSGSRYGSDSATPGIPNQKPHLRTDSDSVFFDKPSPLPSEGQRTQSSQNKFTEHSVGVGRKESMKMAYGTFDENEHHYATPYAHQRNSSEVLSPNARDPATSHSRSSSFADYMPMHYNNSPNVNRLGEIKEEGSEVRWQEAVRKSKSLGHDMGNYINVEINKGELALQKGSDSDRSDTEKKKEITPGVKQTGSEPPRMRRHKDKKSADSTIAKSANDQSSGGESSKGSKSDAESIPQSGGQPLSESELKKLQQKAVLDFVERKTKQQTSSDSSEGHQSPITKENAPEFPSADKPPVSPTSPSPTMLEFTRKYNYTKAQRAESLRRTKSITSNSSRDSSDYMDMRRPERHYQTEWSRLRSQDSVIPRRPLSIGSNISAGGESYMVSPVSPTGTPEQEQGPVSNVSEVSSSPSQAPHVSTEEIKVSDSAVTQSGPASSNDSMVTSPVYHNLGKFPRRPPPPIPGGTDDKPPALPPRSSKSESFLLRNLTLQQREDLRETTVPTGVHAGPGQQQKWDSTPQEDNYAEQLRKQARRFSEQHHKPMAMQVVSSKAQMQVIVSYKQEPAQPLEAKPLQKLSSSSSSPTLVKSNQELLSSPPLRREGVSPEPPPMPTPLKNGDVELKVDLNETADFPPPPAEFMEDSDKHGDKSEDRREMPGGIRQRGLRKVTRERVQQYEGFVADHQQYNDAYNQCIEWLNSIREKLSLCADIAGDRHTIQSRLDKIQDILATKMEGEPKVKNIVALSEKVLPNTAPQGKDIIVRETEALRADWEAFVTALQKTKQDLESCMDQWKEFDSWFERCNNWLKDVEGKVKDTELKATFKDKQGQLDKLKKLQDDLVAKQGDIDALSDAAQDLVRISTDTRVVSQSSQLATKYQTLRVNIKELCRRWEQYVLDHQAYSASFDQCKAWVAGMRKKLQSQSDVKGDKRTVQERIEKLQDLMADKEEGLHMLQISLDNLQIVLPNTNVAGRDNMRREMQMLQAEYDTLSADLNDTRNKLDGTLAQWTVYDDSIEQLRRWLNDLENQIQTERHLQNTLQEKKLQLERIKVLQLNIGSQQSTIDNLNEKARTLQQSSSDPNLTGQIRQIVEKYSRLTSGAKELHTSCEKYVRNHQLYRDSYMDTSDWLGTTVDKMNMCSDMRGDRTTIEAQLHKLLDLQTTIEAGRQKLDDTLGRGDAVLPETSKQGQELIREELNMLTNDFEQFDTDINDLQTTLEKLRDEWLTYEEDYEKLNQWIKDTETDMKAESEQKATLEEKSIQLEKQQTVHEEVTGQQAKFDNLTEHAQVLLQSTTDNRITSQLTQMSGRYTTLISGSKEFLKRYERQVQDHQQYAETFTEAVTWLQGTRDKLSVCADTSGDKYTIQTQLEKLQEFVVVKEEGQLLIHTAQSWGEKTMGNTSVDGRDMIRQELQQLQQEWDAMVGEVTDTKVMLESCLLQWTDFNDSYEQIQKRLRDMEKRLRGTDPKVDLSEKKAELQRIKGLYQDVISYEQMMESAGVKAQDLMQRSPASKASTDTSQILNKYHALKDLAMDMLAKAELNVAQHTAYHDSCNSFMSWLRTDQEKLATCSDTFGEKSAIVGKIERAKALVASLGEGSQRLSDATKAGEATLPNTSPTGQTRIRQEVKSMNKDFEEFRQELISGQEELEECLTRWTEFEDSYAEFNNWLKETEGYLRSELDLKATVEEKKRHWEQYQAFMEDVQYRQANLDHVNEKAQSLLQTNADAKTSHAITQLTTRYQGVIALSKDIVKNLAVYYNNNLHYQETHNQFGAWLADIKHHLQSIHRTAGSKEDLGSKLDNMADMQSAMDQGHSLLRQLLECSEKTLPHTNTRGCQVIRQEAETAKAEYENLLTDTSQAKRGLESALTQWGDFDRSHEQFHMWLTGMESKVNADPGNKSDLPEKKSSLEKFKALQADCSAHRELLERLEEKAANVNDAHPQSRVLDLRSRYSAVSSALRELVSKLDGQVSSHEEYRKGYIGCLDWMANTRHRLQRLSDFSGDRRTLEDRLQQLKEFKGEMRQGQDMVNNATQMGERVCLTTAPRGQDAIRKELQVLKDDWSGFTCAVNDVESNLDSCIGNWVGLDDQLQGFTRWMEKMENKIKTLNESKTDMSRKQQLSREAEDLLAEIVKKKSSLEQVRERGDAVAQRSTDPRLSNNMMQLTTKYQALNSAAKNLVSKLGENAKDHKGYNEAFDAATKWLAMMDERVHECNDTAGDWHTLQDRMDAVKNITASMDDGLQKVNLVCDLAEKILPNTSSEGKRLIEQQVTELTNEWEKLNMSITDCNAMLEGVQERWNDYEEYYGSIVKWLADTENTLGMDPEPKAQLVEKKTQMDKYKLMLSDIDNHQHLVNELAERVANLEALSENAEVTDSLQDVQLRYDRVRTRSRELVNKLDRNYQEHLGFHEAQQESEKWLLQTSFRLMNHNSLNCCTMELTQRQIDKHRMLLREIEEYRSILDRVSMKGRRLIDNNPRTPRMAEQVQTQLQNLEESFINLQSTAEQIRDRLADVLKRWNEYRSALESCDHFLTGEFPHWLRDTDSDIPDSMNDAQRKLEGVKAMWERQGTMRQDIQTAAHRCENLGSVDNLDEGDNPANSPITKLAATMNEGLQQATGEVERRLNQIRDNMGQWDSVDRMRADLRAWLHDMQEEVDELEQQPSKLHAEAAELDISKLQAIREEVQARGPAIEGLLARYRDLTQHNAALQDPVVKAVKDDWEELLGQIENLIEDREQAMQAAKELQARENDMDDDLENYINELEKIETAEVATTQKANMMKTRKPCRSTQTPRGAAPNPNRSFLTGDSDDDDDDFKKQFPRRRPGSRASSHHSVKHRKGLNSSRHHSPRHSRPGSRYDNLKKSSSGAALDSESEESGYGETYYTMHASSFDNNLDATSVFEQPTLDTMRGTPIGLENHFSDGESTVSYLSTNCFERPNPEDLRDADSQTPGHTGTQTPGNMWDSVRNKPRNIMTQTQSQSSLHSIGNQTRRSSGSRADLLRNILFEVKGLKEQRGLDNSSYQGSEDDDRSIASDNTIKKETLQTVLEDVRTLREVDATGNAATQTVQEEGTQTSMKLFPEGDPLRNARVDRFRNLMDDVKQMKGSRAGTPSTDTRTSTRATTPMEPRRHHATPAKFPPPNEPPVQNGYHYQQPQQNLNATAPPIMAAPMFAPPPGRRMVTQDDLNAINQRLERLQSYVTPQRPTPPPPPPQPEYVIPVYAQPPRQRRPPKEDAYLSDESEYGEAEPPRRRQIRASLDSALAEASNSALQLKRLSKRMKDSLRDDMQYDFL